MVSDGETLVPTRRGAETRERIVEAAADLIWQRGVAGTTIDDVKSAAHVSSSQMYHYFSAKDTLVRAVIAYRADTIVRNQHLAAVDSVQSLKAWLDTAVTILRDVHCRGGCPLGSLGGQLAEGDDLARAALADSFTRWEHAIRNGLQSMRTRGALPASTDVEELATAMLAALQGGLLLTQVQRDTRPLEAAMGAMITLVELQARGRRSSAPSRPRSRPRRMPTAQVTTPRPSAPVPTPSSELP